MQAIVMWESAFSDECGCEMHADLLGAEVGAGAQVVQGPAALAPPRLRALLASAPHREELQGTTWRALT